MKKLCGRAVENTTQREMKTKQLRFLGGQLDNGAGSSPVKPPAGRFSAQT